MKPSLFSDQPVWLKALILGGGICLITGLFYLLDLHPRFKQIERYKKEIAKLTAENDAHRKEILRFKSPTKAELASWGTLSSRLKKRIPKTKDVLKVAKLLAERAVENHLMDVSIKMSTQTSLPTGPLTIAGKETSPSPERHLLKELNIQSFVMKTTYLSSLQDSLAFLDALVTDSNTFLHLERIEFKKDFPFIRTQVSIRFYYGGNLDVEE